MSGSYLEVTYRAGRPLAAYYYLPRCAGVKCVRTEQAEGGLIVDFATDGSPIGIEITFPASFQTTQLNAVLERLGQPPATPADVAPLVAA